MEEVEFVSYIDETGETKNQVVTMSYRTSKITEAIESNPISVEIRPFFSFMKNLLMKRDRMSF